jgi:hypothetical protein
MNAIFDAQRRQDSKVTVDGAWVTDLMDGYEVVVWPVIDLKLNKKNCATLDAWLEARDPSVKLQHLSDQEWCTLEARQAPDELPPHLFKLVEAIGCNVWEALDIGDLVPDELFEPKVSKIEIRRTPVNWENALKDIRLAADFYKRAEAALVGHDHDETRRKALRMACDAVINTANRLSVEGFPSEIDLEHTASLTGLADGRQVGLQAVIPKKPKKKYRVEAKNWLRSKGLTQLDRLGGMVLNALFADDPTLPSHAFGMITWAVFVQRKR